MIEIAATAENLGQLFQQIKCDTTIDPDMRLYLQNQTIIYMTFLDDLAEGKVSCGPDDAEDLTGHIDAFCELIKKEVVANAGAGA